MVKVKARLLFWLAIIVGTVVLAGIFLSVAVAEQYKVAAIERSKQGTANFIIAQASVHLNPSDFTADNYEQKEDTFSQFFKGIDTAEIVRIKVWSKEGTVVYSDKKEIVGQNFADNASFQDSLSGNLVAVIKAPTKTENVAEGGYEQLMEVYVPITDAENKVIGIIETYTLLNFVNQSIEDTNKIIFGVILSSVLAVSLVVIFVFFNVQKNTITPIIRLQDATREIASGNFNVNMDSSGNDEIHDLVEDVNMMAKNLAKQKEHLIQSERLSVVGELSARVAHDLRNPLSVTKNAIEILKISGRNDEKMQKHFEMIQRALERMSYQIENVLGFVKSRPLNLKQEDLREILHNVISTIKIPQEIELTVESPPIFVECDSGLLETAFTNLVMNAKQAIGRSGRITIRAREDQGAVIIELEDSGPGVPQDAMSKIFEPLYTTKQQGTGLGLASTKKIIESHGGEISVRNDPTVFTVRLPKKIELPPVR